MTFWVLDIDIFIRWSNFTQAFSYIKSIRYQNRKPSDKQNRHIITSKHSYMWLHFIPSFVSLDSTNCKLLGTIVFTMEKNKIHVSGPVLFKSMLFKGHLYNNNKKSMKHFKNYQNMTKRHKINKFWENGKLVWQTCLRP